MNTGNIQWNMQGQEGSQPSGVTTTLTLNCRTDGTIHLEAPQSQGGYSGDFSSPQEAAQEFASLLEQGMQQASSS